MAQAAICAFNQAVIDEDFDVLPVKAEFPAEARFRFQTAARGQRRAGGLDQAVLIAAVENGLAVVANAQAIAGVVDAVVSLVSNQDDSRPCGNVGVIGNVDQQLIAVLTFNPTVKDRDQRLEIGILGILYEEFHIHVLKLHAQGSL